MRRNLEYLHIVVGGLIDGVEFGIHMDGKMMRIEEK
jgi:hypothetical protein